MDEESPALLGPTGTRPSTWPRETPALELLCAAIAIGFIATFAMVSLQRASYPYALEWIEGGLLDEMRRVLRGQAIYVEPSIEYVPFIYNPLYFWLSALTALIVGPGFLAMRVVSIASSFGTFALVFAFTYRQTASRIASIIAAGFYAATFHYSEQFMDLARVDALFVLGVVGTIYTLSLGGGVGSRALGGALFVLTFLTKQTFVLAYLPLALFAMWDPLLQHGNRARSDTDARARAQSDGEVSDSPGSRSPSAAAARSAATRHGSAWAARLTFPIVAALGTLSAILVLNRISDGWYWYYAFEIPGQHDLVPSMFREFWTDDLMGRLALACVASLFVIFGPSTLSVRDRALWLAAVLGTLAVSYSSRLHDGGWRNVVMPAFAIIACLFGIAVHELASLGARLQAPSRHTAMNFVFIAAGIQFALVGYNPFILIPREADAAAGSELVATLRAADGEVFAPADSYLAGLAGKPAHCHEMAVNDLLRVPSHPTRDTLIVALQTALRRHRWAMVITDDDFFAQDVVANYRRIRWSIPDETAFYPVAGATYRPGWLFEPPPR